MEKQKFNQKEIEKAIKDYLNDKVYSYAFMLDGEWGSGKTYFMKNIVIPQLEESGEKKCIYVSLYGISSIEEINKLVFMNIALGLKRTEKMGRMTEAGITLLAKVLKPFIPVPDVLKDTKNIENILEAIMQNIEMENVVFVFDDLERCSCQVKEVFGYLNTFVEQNKSKVILIANEKEIISHWRKIVNGEQEGGYEDDYLHVKEKLVGITFHFYPNVKNIMTNIINSNEAIDLKLKDELLTNLNYIEGKMEGHKNLRTFQFYLSKINFLYQEIKNEQYENETEIYKKLSTETMEACVKLKKGEELEITPDKFEFVRQYVKENLYDKGEMLKVIRKFDEWLTFEKRDREGSMSKLKCFNFTEDQEVENAMNIVLERLEKNVQSIYTKDHYFDMLRIFVYYSKKIGIGKEYVGKLETLIIKKFELDKTDKRKYQYSDDSTKKDWQDIIERIYERCQERKKDEIQQKLETCLLSKNWCVELRDIVGPGYGDTDSEGISFLDKIDIQLLTEKIEQSSAEDLIRFKDLLGEIYGKRQEINIEVLEDLKERIEELKDCTNEKIKKYHLDTIIEEIKNVIKMQEIAHYTGID